MKNAFEYERELAVLREELAQSRILAADQALNLKRVKREFESMRDRKNSIVDLQQRLTAADQRNAELVELLTEALGSVYVDAGKCENTQAWKETTALAERIEAAIKPTESGASDE